MQRRKFIAGVGSLAAGAAAVTGTGAFSFVQADRDVTVSTTADSSALLALEPYDGPNGQYAQEVDGGNTIALDFTQNDEASDTGLNDEAFINIENVLSVENQGTQDVFLSVGVPGGQTAVPTAEFSVSGNDEDVKRNAEIGTDPSGTVDLSPGESNSIGFFFNLDSSDDLNDILSTLESNGIVICAGTGDQFERGIFPGQ
ncbi:hypothetical protein [Haloplanus salinus]|uniref:hypothetical protein n=1 Tax=Haloplanus salinus TaxID=1126245 RepID=UPI0015F0BB40|nr:hypothetical protein [Haloplanus salinus]